MKPGDALPTPQDPPEPVERSAEGASEAPPEASPGAARPPSDEPRSLRGRLERLGVEVDPGISLHGEGSGPPATRGFTQKILAKASRLRRYAEGEEIARGGMGRILRVWDEDLRRNLAMKLLLHRGREDATASRGFDEELLARFLEEAQITGQLDHPGVVPVHDLGIDDEGRVYFTMRLVRGRDLREILELVAKREEGWTLAKGIGVVLKVCEAMAFAHSKGVVHRDLKPANVMVGRFGETYVMDWGLARVLGRPDSHDVRPRTTDTQISIVRTSRHDEQSDDPASPLGTMDGDVIGTPSYMAPEQAGGRLEEVGPRSDVYSLGAILYHMLAGRAPHVAPGERVSPHVVLTRVLEGPPEPVLAVAPDVAPELAAICEKAMAREPDARYAGMLEVAADLEAFLEGRVVRAYEAGAVAEFRKWVRRNRGLAASLAAAVLLALGGLGTVAALQARRSAELQAANVELATARAQALENAARARESEREARRNEEAALAARGQAAESEALARRRSYAANLVAAASSLRLNEIDEARRFLERCEPDLRGWEWQHLNLQLESQLGTARTGAAVTGMQRLADGRLFVSDMTGWSVWELPEGRTTPHLVSRRQGLVNYMQLRSGVSSDGRWLAFSMPRTREVRVLSLARAAGEGDEVRKITLASPPSTVEFDASGRFLAVAAVEAVLVYDVETLELRATIPIPGDGDVPLAWAPGALRLAIGADEKVLVHDVALAGTPPEEPAAAASPPSPLLGAPAAAEANAPEPALALELPETRVTALCWSPDATQLAVGGADGRIRVYEASGEFDFAAEAHGEGALASAVTRLAFHPARAELASGGDDGRIVVWSTAPGVSERERRMRVYFAHGKSSAIQSTAPVTGLVFFDDLLLSSGEDGALRSWDVQVGGAVTELHAQDGGQTAAVAFSPDGALCATTDSAGVVSVWDAWAGELRSLLRGHEARITAVDWSDDGSWILTGASDSIARLWDARTGVVAQVLRGHDEFVRDVALDADGSVVATASGDETVRLWDAATGLTVRVLEGHDRWVNAVEVDRAGERVYTGSSDGTVRAWRAATGEEVAVLLRGSESVVCLALDAGETRLAAGLEDGRILVLAAEDGERLVEIPSFGGAPTSVAFHPSGTRLAVGGFDQLVRLFDARTGDFLLALEGHEGAVLDLAFSPDGSRLLSTGPGWQDDEAARIWETGSLAERRERRREVLALRREAEPLVGQLFSRHLFLNTVVEALQSDRSLGDDLRKAALSLAKIRGNDALKLAEESWAVVANGGADPERVAAALQQAEVACGFEPESRACAIVLGAAQLRAGEALRARVTLQEATRKPVPTGGRESEFRRELDLALPGLLALAHHRLGDGEDARAEAEKLVQGLPSDPAPAATLLSLRDEVASAIGLDLTASPPAPPPGAGG